MEEKIIKNIKEIVKAVNVPENIKQKFFRRLEEGKISIDENPGNHFCVYFPAYDPIAKQVFIGQHIKSNLWLFNGGHVDKDETPKDTLYREISEEWGKNIIIENAYSPTFLTVTEINIQLRKTKRKCKFHYDFWNFVKVDKKTFLPDMESIKTEFYMMDWKTIEEASKLVVDPNTLLALKEIEKLFLIN
jgi:8-oxo-dGTP pyrophosphatase MutT (NUDIX family)